MFHGDLLDLLKSAGYVGMFLSVLLENGVIFLFFMPSDSLLFTAGLLAALGYFDIYMTISVCFAGSILGYCLGYALGFKAGPKVFRESNTKLMTAKHLEHAKEFYNKYASFALVLARFFPVRAFVSTMAGASHVDYATFMIYNVLGGAIWSIGLILIGYFFGRLLTPDDLHTVFGVLFAGFLVVVIGMPFLAKHLKNKYEKREESVSPQGSEE